MLYVATQFAAQIIVLQHRHSFFIYFSSSLVINFDFVMRYLI